MELQVSKAVSIIILLGAAAGTSYYYFTHSTEGGINANGEYEINLNDPNNLTIQIASDEDSFYRVTESQNAENNPNIKESSEARQEKAAIAEETRQQKNAAQENAVKISENTAENTQNTDQNKTPVVKKEINVLGEGDTNVAVQPAGTNKKSEVKKEPETEKKTKESEQEHLQSTPVTPTPAQIVNEFKTKFNLPIKLSQKETLANFTYTTADGFTYVIKTTDHSIETKAKTYYARYACQNEQVKGLFDYSKTVSFAFVNNKTGKTISRVNVNPDTCKKIMKQAKANNNGAAKPASGKTGTDNRKTGSVQNNKNNTAKKPQNTGKNTGNSRKK